MSPELDEFLFERYPALFVCRRALAVDDGWYDLLDALCHCLQEATANGDPQVVAEQVKEKFGGLRFYTKAGPSDHQRGAIRMAELMSQRLCETCGKPGKLQKITPLGPIATLCEEHLDRTRKEAQARYSEVVQPNNHFPL
ncbi:hypothetical protein [Burkholderia vietnamiensis]|uniref:hypothetical protein n=1 Tax=Burkholderia vietnamiensis TaxID=60552 RepID=UPI00158A8825|nr:hypothetical protein [Burkholderia vietnamiensis]